MLMAQRIFVVVMARLTAREAIAEMQRSEGI